MWKKSRLKYVNKTFNSSNKTNFFNCKLGLWSIMPTSILIYSLCCRCYASFSQFKLVFYGGKYTNYFLNEVYLWQYFEKINAKKLILCKAKIYHSSSIRLESQPFCRICLRSPTTENPYRSAEITARPLIACYQRDARIRLRKEMGICHSNFVRLLPKRRKNSHR